MKRGERVAFEKYSYNGANALADYDINNNATARYPYFVILLLSVLSNNMGE